jgi:hypothetical protein
MVGKMLVAVSVGRRDGVSGGIGGQCRIFCATMVAGEIRQCVHDVVAAFPPFLHPELLPLLFEDGQKRLERGSVSVRVGVQKL